MSVLSSALLNRMTIARRLQLNMVLALAMLSLVAWGGWSAMSLALQGAHSLQQDEARLQAPVGRFQRDYAILLQVMNDHIITMNEAQGQAFNQQLDQLRHELMSLLQSLGAPVEKGGNGLLQLRDDAPP